MNKIKYLSCIYDDNGFELNIYKCLECKDDIYIGENCKLNYCPNCGRKIIYK